MLDGIIQILSDWRDNLEPQMLHGSGNSGYCRCVVIFPMKGVLITWLMIGRVCCDASSEILKRKTK